MINYLLSDKRLWMPVSNYTWSLFPSVCMKQIQSLRCLHHIIFCKQCNTPRWNKDRQLCTTEIHLVATPGSVARAEWQKNLLLFGDLYCKTSKWKILIFMTSYCLKYLSSDKVKSSHFQVWWHVLMQIKNKLCGTWRTLCIIIYM